MQATDSSEQSQRDSCEPLTAVAEWVSDKCLGTQHPALSAAGSRGHAGRQLGCRYSTSPAQYKDDKSYVVAAVFLELLESL